jgi:hypothetical protein
MDRFFPFSHHQYSRAVELWILGEIGIGARKKQSAAVCNFIIKNRAVERKKRFTARTVF